MFHLFVAILCLILVVVSKLVQHVPQNVEITLMIISIIAFIRYVIERETQKFELIIQNAKELEMKDKSVANKGITKQIIAFREDRQMFPGFCDFYVVLESGEEIILSTSKPRIINMLKQTKEKMVIYYVEGIIVDVEAFGEDKSLLS